MLSVTRTHADPMATALSSSRGGLAAHSPGPRAQPTRRPTLPAVVFAVADHDAPPVSATSIQPVVPRAELSAGIASFYDESSGLWESMW